MFLNKPIKNNKTIVLLSFVLLFLYQISDAQKLYAKNTGVIAGHIYDEVGEVLIEANVTIVGTSLGAATNDKGYYFITNIPEGEYVLKVQYVGYFTESTTKIPVKNDATVKVDFNMEPNVMIMDEIVGETDKEKLKTSLDVAKFKKYKNLNNGFKIKYILMVGGIPVLITIHEDVFAVGMWAHIEYFFWDIFN